MFWLVMTIVASVLAATYLGLAASGTHMRLSADRRAKLHRSGILLIGWAAVCYGHLMLATRR